jgi:hypothetical protein
MIEYNSNYTCSYNFTDDDDELYQKDILQIFNIQNFDEEGEKKINETCNKIFLLLKDNEIINDCCLKAANEFFNEDKEIGFIILFSYYYLHKTHECVKEFLNTGNISKENLDNLAKLIEYNKRQN